MAFNFSGKIALVTGASRGIGRAVAVELARGGAYVFVNYTSNGAAAEAAAAECRAAGGAAETMQFDVASSEAVDQAVDKIKEHKGQLDILVNNAGISKDGLFIRLKNEDWDRTLGVNLSGAFYCARAAAKLMMKARSGRIINISSVVGEVGNAGQVPYVSAKAGMIGLTKALAKELASRNVTVNAITPGFIETDMTETLDARLKEELRDNIPLARMGAAQDVANAVAFLASEGASYITGQVLGVNGGMRM